MEEIAGFIVFCLMVLWVVTAVVSIVGGIAGAIRNIGYKQELAETMENSCAGCVHLYFDNNDKPRCDLAFGGWRCPDICDFYRSSKY